ncbi:MAG: UPF0175 family protein [Acidobacteria bacterium]|nr:UPF0175 family protein [Acidobacteriota bacterium]
MQVILELPEDILTALANRQISPDRTALEGLAAEGYRTGVLTEAQLLRLLGLPSRAQVHEWLKTREIPYRYSAADFEGDLETLHNLGLR